MAEPKSHGDRIQTFMVYLTDVEAGGATAFPFLGLSVWPKRGDAITWYNMYRYVLIPLKLRGR
jgi:prolyl 4-hydroxylase